MPRRKTPVVPTAQQECNPVIDSPRQDVEHPVGKSFGREMLEKFEELINGLYTSSLHWQRHEEEAPSLIYVRKEFGDWLTHLKGFLQKHEDHPELNEFLAALKQVVLDYKFQDKPVMVDGRLDLKQSRLRSDFPLLDDARGMSQVEDLASDREHVLGIERIELWDRVERLIGDLGHKRAGSKTATNGHERLKWKSSIAAFEYIITTLAKQGYFDIPKKGGKNGEPNLAALARALLLAFELGGKDEQPLSIEKLRLRLSPGSESKLSASNQDKFQIPDHRALIIPPIEDLT
jgi:hypothetical protein